MSADTLIYKNAFLLIGGASFAAQFSELTVDYKAELLDRTTFNTTTRERRGGLFAASIKGKGFVAYGPNSVAEVLFGDVGAAAVPMVMFPDGINEGSQLARGFAMFGQVESFNVSGVVGALTPFDIGVESSGLGF